MGVATIAGVLILAGAVVSVLIPTGRVWLTALGVAGTIVTALLLLGTGGYEGFEGPSWVAIALLVFYFGGGWSIGIFLGYLVRDGLGRMREGLR
jgi:hypothetical protein